jgi:hypothetical protein
MTNPQDKRRFPNFAPFSGANSSGLRIASGYFLVTGILTILIISVAFVAGMFVEPGLAAEVKGHALRFFLGSALQLIASAGWIWTGVLLSKRRRLGGILAILFLLLPLVSIAASVPIKISTIVLSVIGLVVVASVWNELVNA